MEVAQLKYLRSEDLRRASLYRFDPTVQVEGYYAGRHRSQERGISTEFRDYRAYVPGDDPKRVDWRVYARTDKLHQKTYQHETSTDCYLMLDCSASMEFGGEFKKIDFASYLAASISYLVTTGQDRCGLTLFDSKVRRHITPGSTTSHFHDMVRALEDNSPAGETSLAQVLGSTLPLISQRGSLVILSDFFEEAAGVFEALNPFLHKGFKIFLFQILAPEEIDFSAGGLFRFKDMESGSTVVTHTSTIADAYREAMQNHIRSLRELSRRRGIFHTMARTDQPFYPLFDILAKRKQ